MAHLLVTGASGYIGRQVVASARAQGHVVTISIWRLHALPGPEAFAGVDAVIHLAHSWRDEEAPQGGDLNLWASENLARGAFAAGVARFVFVSSVSARADALNRYGRTKHIIETQLAKLSDAQHGVVVARVGLVYGGAPSGQYATMRRLARLPLLPMVGLGREVQPIHIEDVAQGLVTLAAGPPPARPRYVLAGARPMRFGQWLKLLHRAETGAATMVLLPVPFRPVLALLRLCASIPFLHAPDPERVLGLAGTRPQPSDLRLLGIAPGDPAERLLSRRFARRAAIREALILLRYLTGTARPGMTARLVRLMASDGETAIQPPRPLRIFDQPSRQGQLTRHLRLAAIVSENTARSKSRLGGTLAGLVLDMLAMPLRLTLGRLAP